MTEEVKGLAKAVAYLRAELHSLALGGSRIVIEVDAEKWHALRVKSAAAGDVEEIVLASDVTAGDVIVRQKPQHAPVHTVEQLHDLGMAPPTLGSRIEAIEKQLTAMLTRGIPTMALFDQLLEFSETLKQRVDNLDKAVWP